MSSQGAAGAGPRPYCFARLSVHRGRERKGDHSLPLPSYSAVGGLRQDQGHAEESPAEIKILGVPLRTSDRSR
jgi:hypothetical protein